MPLDNAQIGIAVATGVGLAIGLERGWKEIESQHHTAAGIRTFTLIGLLGGLAGWLQLTQGVNAILVGFVSVTLLASVAYLIDVWRSGDVGLTSEIALLITFLLGATAGTGYWATASGVAVAVALILGLKAEIHNVVRHLDHSELLATLQLLVLAGLVVPLLPAREVFGLEGLNPRHIGLLTLLISGISYVGYFSVQILGQRKGLLLTAALGGLTSSTAVTVSFSRLARANSNARRELAAGVAVACAVMAPRLLLIVGVVAPALVTMLVWTLSPLTLIPIAVSIWWLRRVDTPREDAALELKNPLALGTALTFALLLMVLLVALPVIRDAFGDLGVFALAVLSGITDVDAISLAIANSVNDASLGQRYAVLAIVLATVVNTVFKASVAFIVSKGALRSVAGVLAASAVLTGVIAVPLLW